MTGGPNPDAHRGDLHGLAPLDFTGGRNPDAHRGDLYGLAPLKIAGGRDWTRTSDLSDVNRTL